jgi:ribonuclease E
MTFYEAALRVLEEAGTPLLSSDITKRAIEKGLLSHIGKTPEVTMLSRLATIARRPRDKKLHVTAKDTFALTDWLLPEDAEALAVTGLFEPNPEEGLPPYRPLERHPEPHGDFLRTIGRQSDRRRRDDDRKKKLVPLGEVALEVLQEAMVALSPADLLARIKARDGAAEEMTVASLLHGLAVDNQKRVDESRRPLFEASRGGDNELQLSLSAQIEGGPLPVVMQQSFCEVTKLPFENGRLLLKSEQRPIAPSPAPIGVVAAVVDEGALVQTARLAGKDARKSMARVLRKKLSELELATLEKACVRMMHGLHFRELKVSRRSKDGLLLTARRREGSLEIRYAARLVRGGAQVERRHVQEIRKELQHTGSHVGLLLSAGEARSDARAECTNGPLVMLWAGDAFADKFLEAKVGVSVTTIEIFDIDEAFFAQAKIDAEESTRRREERHRERDPRISPVTTPAVVAGAAADAHQGGALLPRSTPLDVDASDESDSAEPAPGEPAGAVEGEGANGDVRRRRRRRRRRRGMVAGAPATGASLQADVRPTAPAVQQPEQSAAEVPPPQPAPAIEPN